MPYATFSSPVNASFETVWGMLLDKIENPQRYITAVEETKVLQRYDNGILREMRIPGMQLKERITVTEEAREIKFTLVEHPLFSGEIINKVEFPSQEDSGESLILTFTQNWQPLNEEAENLKEAKMQETIKNAVLHMKELAEERDSHSRIIG
ncbi:MAG: AtaL-like protein [Potamolinea sp.]